MATIEQRLRFILTGNVEVVRGLKTLSREQQTLIREFQQGNRTYNETRNALKGVARGYEDAEQSADSFRNGIKALRQEQERLNQLESQQRRFDRTSQQVGLAGDVQSNLGAVSGLAGSIPGGGGAGQAIGIAGELIVLTEELPRLKTAVQGLPQAANAAGAALGVGGAGGLIGVLGIAAVAIGAVSLAFQEFQRQANQAKAEFQSLVNARRDVINQLPELTTSEIETQTARNEIILAGQEELLADLRAGYEELNAFQKGLDFITGGTAKKEIKEQESIVRDLRNANRELDAARNSEIVRQNDAREASQQSAQEFQNLARQAQNFSQEAERAGQRTNRASREFQRSFSSSRGSGSTRRGGGGLVLGRSGGSLFGLGGAREAQQELSDEQKAQAKQTNDDLKRIYEDRNRLIVDFNKREADIRRESIFNQRQDLEKFDFDQRQLFRSGNFTQAFRNTEEKAFSQAQTEDRLQFEANTRQRELNSELARITQELRQLQQIQVQVTTNTRMLDARIQAGATNNSFGISRIG